MIRFDFNRFSFIHFFHFLCSFIDRLDYGVVHNQRCERFKLDKNIPLDNNFIGHLDGKLYVNESEQPYDIDSYCIEFINIATINVIFFRSYATRSINECIISFSRSWRLLCVSLQKLTNSDTIHTAWRFHVYSLE